MSQTDLQFLERAIRSSPVLGPVLDRWAEVRLPGAWLAAGAVAQTVWNAKLGYPPDHGIRDVDIVYFDGEDLTAESEQAEAQRIASLFAHSSVRCDVKNEARVHLWYEARFGSAIAPYRSTEDAIATFPTTARRALRDFGAIRADRPISFDCSPQQDADQRRDIRSEAFALAKILAASRHTAVARGGVV